MELLFRPERQRAGARVQAVGADHEVEPAPQPGSERDLDAVGVLVEGLGAADDGRGSRETIGRALAGRAGGAMAPP